MRFNSSGLRRFQSKYRDKSNFFKSIRSIAQFLGFEKAFCGFSEQWNMQKATMGGGVYSESSCVTNSPEQITALYMDGSPPIKKENSLPIKKEENSPDYLKSPFSYSINTTPAAFGPIRRIYEEYCVGMTNTLAPRVSAGSTTEHSIRLPSITVPSDPTTATLAPIEILRETVTVFNRSITPHMLNKFNLAHDAGVQVRHVTPHVSGGWLIEVGNGRRLLCTHQTIMNIKHNSERAGVQKTPVEAAAHRLHVGILRKIR